MRAGGVALLVGRQTEVRSTRMAFASAIRPGFVAVLLAVIAVAGLFVASAPVAGSVDAAHSRGSPSDATRPRLRTARAGASGSHRRAARRTRRSGPAANCSSRCRRNAGGHSSRCATSARSREIGPARSRDVGSARSRDIGSAVPANVPPVPPLVPPLATAPPGTPSRGPWPASCGARIPDKGGDPTLRAWRLFGRRLKGRARRANSCRSSGPRARTERRIGRSCRCPC